LQHEPQLVGICSWIFRLFFNIETVRANPSGSAADLEFFNAIRSSYKHFQRYVPATALAITDSCRNPAIGLAGFD